MHEATRLWWRQNKWLAGFFYDSSMANDNTVIFFIVIFIIETSPSYEVGWYQRAWGCSNGREKQLLDVSFLVVKFLPLSGALDP